MASHQQTSMSRSRVICSLYSNCDTGAFGCHGLTLIPARISNHNHYKVWEEITYPFPKFNSAAVSNFIPHLTEHVITYPWWDWSQTMLVKVAPAVNLLYCCRNSHPAKFRIDAMLSIAISWLRDFVIFCVHFVWRPDASICWVGSLYLAPKVFNEDHICHVRYAGNYAICSSAIQWWLCIYTHHI